MIWLVGINRYANGIMYLINKLHSHEQIKNPFGILASLLSVSSFAQSDSTSSIEVVDYSTSVSESFQPERKSIVMSHVVFENSESSFTVYAVPESVPIKIIN